MSLASAESATWLEAYGAKERLGESVPWQDRPAREVEAMMLLDQERRKWERENDGE